MRCTSSNTTQTDMTPAQQLCSGCMTIYMPHHLRKTVYGICLDLMQYKSRLVKCGSGLNLIGLAAFEQNEQYPHCSQFSLKSCGAPVFPPGAKNSISLALRTTFKNTWPLNLHDAAVAFPLVADIFNGVHQHGANRDAQAGSVKRRA